MADARALLRAHRAENRIKHPHAAYSDVGKLLCKLCHDAVKTESLWDAHIRSQAHRQRLQALQQQPSPPTQGTDESTHKRKRSEDADETMSDADEGPDATRVKRSRTDTVVSNASTSNSIGSGVEGNKEKIQTPPGLSRRISGTPVHGVEIAIPSRPATPLAGSNSAVSTPKAATSRSRSLVGSETSSTSGALLAQQQGATSIPISNDALVPPAQNAARAPPASNISAAAQASAGAVDEAEWAAFEAEMTALDAAAPPAGINGVNGSAHTYADATISAPALSAAQVAAKSQEEENERRKHAADAEIADEREDATRALEAEFEEMEELEGRVRRLKERREELRKESVMNLRAAATASSSLMLKAGGRPADGKENVRATVGEDFDEDDEEDEEEEDDWDGFRFRV
ncbi:hypothetical protein GGR51DRAFT_507446 [Nemania sp. FL0031]|nr:hypothetical protein GGR51DRAFT_507446 [Nemania sp. FL0031]